MTTQDYAAQALWRRGVLDWKLHSAQISIKQALDKTKGKLFVGNCARQLGKSYTMCCHAIEVAIRQPRARIKYATAFLSDLVEFILPNFDAILEDCPNAVRPVYKAQKSKWVFPNGSEIKLIGVDKNPNGLRGNAIDLIILDEVGFMARLDYLYKSIIIPATTHRPKAKVIMISTPSETPAHEFTDYCHRAEVENCYAKYTIYDNPMLTPDRILDLMKESGGEDSSTWRREYLCEFVTDEKGHIIPEWSDKFIVAREHNEFFKFYHLYEGMDLGRIHMTALTFGYYDFKRAILVIEDELNMEGPTWTTKTLKDAVLTKEKELWSDRKIYRRISDNNNPHLINDLNSLYGVHFLQTDKDSLEAMVNELRLMVGAGRLEVHPRCKMLIGCLAYGMWDRQRKKFAESKVYGHFDHLAALIYLVRNLDKHTNPIPATYGFDVRNSRIKQQKNQSEGSKMLGQIFHKPTRKPTY